MQDKTIKIEFEDERSEECEIMGIFEVNGKEYIALLSTVKTEKPSIYVYGYEQSSEQDFRLIDIKNRDEFDAVTAELDRVIQDAAR